MRYFTFHSPYGGTNWYAEVPSDWSVDYLDGTYNGVDTFWGLTFGGWAIVRDGKIVSLLDHISVWKDDKSEVTFESIKAKYPLGVNDEIVPVVGGDDNHIEALPHPAIQEAEHLAREIDNLVKEQESV